MEETQPDYAGWVEELPEQFTSCRETRHHWSPWRVSKGEVTYTRTLRCGRCHAEKDQEVDRRGYIIGTKMHYPAGYLAPPGMGRLDTDDMAHMRLVILRRALREDGKDG